MYSLFNATATTEIYTLSLHDALPICDCRRDAARFRLRQRRRGRLQRTRGDGDPASGRCRSLRARAANTTRGRSEEHTSELQSQSNLVCRLLLEKKKTKLLLPTVISIT